MSGLAEAAALLADSETAPGGVAPRLAWLSVDGFGALCGVEIELSRSGLTLLLGPNETGKSTLFDFLAAVLFGFPRRTSPRFRPPVNGGRHGGRVGLVDAAGGTWVLERHAGPGRKAALTRPDGSAGDGSELAHLLGGASAELFRAVFAVDLDDLRQLDGVSSDEVREVLFSSSILGRRRSATDATKQLEVQREALVRPRSGGEGNELAATLRQARAALAEARDAASLYVDLREHAESLEAERREVEAARLATDRELKDVELLQACWASAVERDQAAQRLSQVPPLADDELRVVALGPRLEQLSARLSGHEERAAKHAELLARRCSLARSVSEREAGLALSGLAGASRLPRFDLTEAGDYLHQLSDELVAGRARLQGADEVLARAEDQAAAVANASGEERGDLASAEGLEARRSCMKELRGWLAEADRLSADVERAAASARGDARDDRTASRTVTTSLLASVAVGLGAVAVLGALRAQPLLAAVVGVAAAVVGSLALWLAREPRRRSRERSRDGGDEAGTLERMRSERLARLEEAKRRSAELAAGLGIELPVSSVVLERAADDVERRLELSRRAEAAERQSAEAARSAAEARRRREHARQSLSQTEASLRRFAALHGLPEQAEAVDLRHLVEQLDDLWERQEALERVAAELESTGGSISRFEAEALRVAEGCGVATPSSTGSAEDLRQLLEAAAESVRRLRARAEQRSELERTVASAERELDRVMGRGERVDELRLRLDSGQVRDWELDSESASNRLRDLDEAHEQLVRQHETVTRRLEELARSSDVPRLELDCSELEERLKMVLRRHLVLSAARFLIQGTLRRYEEERQPAVLERAAEHFGRVSSGRYVRLAVDPGADGTKPSLRAFQANGRVIEATDLSRGAMEQLYLCLRLGLAESFADRYVPLPVVLDDVLVNFDPGRADAMLAELAETATRHQVVLLTCHPHLARLVANRVAGASVVHLAAC